MWMALITPPRAGASTWSRRLLPLLAVLGLSALACEPEIGQPCDSNPDDVSIVRVAPGTNSLVQDVRFDNCTQALCLSSNGSRPYCTKECEEDFACQSEAGEDFVCQQVELFNELGCEDYDPAVGNCLESELPIRYCAARTPQVIEARDAEFGRSP